MSDEFTVTGRIELGKGVQQFSREVAAESEEHALDLVYSQLTSEHSISRANIDVEEVE